MNVKITSRKFKARESLKDYVKDEVESITRFYDDILDVEAILSFQNNSNSTKIAELIVKVPGSVITATESSDDFEKSIREAANKVERQLKKLKTKRNDHL
jgi:putative sigma-54 modulation protein